MCRQSCYWFPRPAHLSASHLAPQRRNERPRTQPFRSTKRSDQRCPSELQFQFGCQPSFHRTLTKRTLYSQSSIQQTQANIECNWHGRATAQAATGAIWEKSQEPRVQSRSTVWAPPLHSGLAYLGISRKRLWARLAAMRWSSGPRAATVIPSQ